MGDGSTLRDILEFQQKMYGIRDDRLIEKPLPFTAIPLWNLFWTLHETRQISQYGSLLPITYTEIGSYCALMQMQVEPWEIKVIKAMDRGFLTKLNTTGTPNKESS